MPLKGYLKLPATCGSPKIVNTVIEIPKGNRNKYEVDKKTGLLKLDRYLYSSSHYPGDYGFVPRTLAEDGDPLDVLVMVNKPTFSGCIIEARVLGLFKMVDRGANDFKILAVPNSDSLFDEYQHITDVPQSYLREVEHFFSTYKQLEGVEVETGGWFDVVDAVEIVEQSIEAYKEGNKPGAVSNQGSSNIEISHIDHLALTVMDVDYTCEWYTRVLGMEERVFAGKRRALHFGDQKINVQSFDEDHHDTRCKHPTTGSADLCFIIESDFDEFLDHLEHHKVEIIESGPRTGAAGQMRSVYFYDPDRNLIEVAVYKD